MPADSGGFLLSERLKGLKVRASSIRISRPCVSGLKFRDGRKAGDFVQ